MPLVMIKHNTPPNPSCHCQLSIGKLDGMSVQYVHEKQHVHRDICPANILILDNRLIISDFDLCKKHLTILRVTVSVITMDKKWLTPERIEMIFPIISLDIFILYIYV